jgi:hypothetical protein
LRQSWDEYGTLYSAQQEEAMTRGLRRAVGRRCGGWSEALQPARYEVEDAEAARDPEVDGYYAMTLAEIGAELGVSKERVRGIIERALGKLRHPTRLRGLP